MQPLPWAKPFSGKCSLAATVLPPRATCHFTSGSDSSLPFCQPDQPWLAPRGRQRISRRRLQYVLFSFFSANHSLTASDFPLHQLSNIASSGSAVISDNNNIVGSQGVYKNIFNDVIMGQAAEDQTPVPDVVFEIQDGSGNLVNTRRSQQRNAPSVINAVFNYRNFFLGRYRTGHLQRCESLWRR